jgi:hypothetical protein
MAISPRLSASLMAAGRSALERHSGVREQRGLLTPIKAAAADQTYISSGGSLRHRSQRDRLGPGQPHTLAGASKPAAAPGVPRCSRAEQRGGRAFASIVRWPGLFIRASLRRVILAPGQRLTAAAKVARARRSFTPNRTDSIRPQRSAMSAPVSLGCAKERE